MPAANDKAFRFFKFYCPGFSRIQNQWNILSLIEKYDECLNEKIITVKHTLP